MLPQNEQIYNIMTNYDFLLAMEKAGYMKALFSIGLSSCIPSWMEIFKYHLDHPKLSQFQIATHFDTTKFKVYRVYLFMNQTINGE